MDANHGCLYNSISLFDREAGVKSHRPPSTASKKGMDATHINLHKVVGPMLIGTWLDLMLFALVIDRALYYFHHYYTDRMLAKITVFAALACDMATVISECADVYLNTVTFQGNTGAIQSRQWPRSLDLASTGFSASIVQAFMLHRYWTLTRRKVLTSAVGLVMLSSLMAINRNGGGPINRHTLGLILSGD
ncbi:hypothetical protein D9758_009324 [Tetrapyrgos nigripes]|uniref:Uncharacterized protein n=1 Tax=Tetrapyrgos nigripes TaxID=182062 RepID=A0A8H5GHB5_9AGAR|nr:hypothetical protein D9758_009324 [Tetrapyrgos nigripes]